MAATFCTLRTVIQSELECWWAPTVPGRVCGPLVSDAKPAYTGVSFIEMRISDVETRHPDVSAKVGRGSFFALEDDKGLMAQKNGDGSVRIYVALRMPEREFAALGISFTDPAATVSAILARFQDWNPEITNLVRACDDNFVPRPITALPLGIRWPSQPSVTLIGDAAHQMSPFAGAGANLAMQDGAALALEMVEAPDPSVAIAAYEKKMFERAQEEAQRSADGLAMCISPDGSERFANWMRTSPGSTAARFRMRHNNSHACHSATDHFVAAAAVREGDVRADGEPCCR